MSERFQVRDQRKPGHHWADNEVLDDYASRLGPIGYAIYMFMGRWSGNRDGRCVKTQAEIASCFNLSRGCVNRYIAILADEKLIEIENDGANNLTYVLREVPKKPCNPTAQPLSSEVTRVSSEVTRVSSTITSNKEVRLSSKLSQDLKHIPAQKAPDDSDLSVTQIAQAHPKFRKPVETERAIVEQLDRLGDQMGVASAMKYLLEKTLRYGQAYKRWTGKRQNFSPESPRWFRSACFDEPEDSWIEGEGDGRSKLTESLEAIDRAAANMDKEAPEGNQSPLSPAAARRGHSAGIP